MQFFTFQRLGGDYPALGADLNLGVPTAVFGLGDAEKYLVAAMTERRIVYITADALSAQHAQAAISVLSGKRCALLSAKDEVLTYRKALSRDALYRRLTALYEWESGAEVLVADIEALAQRLFLHQRTVYRIPIETFGIALHIYGKIIMEKFQLLVIGH